MTVLVDRGLYASWLYEQIVALGWHPFLRLNEDMKIRPVGPDQEWQPVSAFVSQPAER